MRRVLFAIAFVLALLVASPPSFAEIEPAGAAVSASVASAPVESPPVESPPVESPPVESPPVEIAPRESLPVRLGKALAFGLVVSLLLVGGGLWRRGRRKRRTK